jgi:hypothetical protein
MHELLFHHQQGLQDSDLWRCADSSGWIVTGSPVIWMAGSSGSGSGPTPTAPSERRPRRPDSVH